MTGNRGPTNYSVTPSMTAKESRRNTQVCTSHSGIRACELYRWQMRESNSFAVGSKDLKVEKPKGLKSKRWDLQMAECLSRLACSTYRRAEAASLQLLRAGDTPTRSTQQWKTPCHERRSEHNKDTRTWQVSYLRMPGRHHFVEIP